MNALIGPLYVVIGVLLLAGAAKLTSPSTTATALRELRVPKPLVSARLLGFGEVLLASFALLTGHVLVLALIAVAYATFTVFIFFALRTGSAIGSCGCFGQEDTPPTIGHAAFNAASAAVAGLAIADGSGLGLLDLEGSATEVGLLILLVVTGVAASVLALTSLPRVLALASGSATPSAPTFSTRGRLGEGS